MGDSWCTVKKKPARKKLPRRTLRKGGASTTRTTRMRDWKKVFLAILSKDPNVSLACEKAKVGRRTAYEARDSDPAFKAAWDEADEAAIDRVESAGLALARAGTSESPSLIKFFLQTRRRDRYPNVARLEHTGKDGGPIETTTSFDLTKLADHEVHALRFLVAKAQGVAVEGRLREDALVLVP